MGLQGYRQLSEESVSARTATPTVQLGERRVDGGKEYVYVYNASSNEAINVGRGVKLASASTGFTVDVAVGAPSTLTAAMCFGVCQDATFATADYGWLLTKGHASALECKLSTVVTGEAFYMGTSGAFQRFSAAITDVVANQAVIANGPVGQVINGTLTTTATATFAAYFKCHY